MPTYEFRCPDGHLFDRFYRKISDGQSEVACPQCGKIATRQMSAGAGLLFKGSGFYLTDYGKNAHRGGSVGDSSKSSEGGSSESQGDSKPSETKASESKPSESKSSESKSGESKSSESKSSESKSSDSKSSSTASTTSSSTGSSGTKSDK